MRNLAALLLLVLIVLSGVRDCVPEARALGRSSSPRTTQPWPSEAAGKVSSLIQRARSVHHRRHRRHHVPNDNRTVQLPNGLTGYRFSANQVQAALEEAQASQIQVKDLAGSDCKICIYVIERIKEGYQNLLPSICVEVFYKTASDPESYGKCHNVLASLSQWGHNVRHWLQYGASSAHAGARGWGAVLTAAALARAGCFRAESYGAMELVKPCPSHVICNQLTNLEDGSFCDPEPVYSPK